MQGTEQYVWSVLFVSKKKRGEIIYIGLLIRVQISSKRTYQEGTAPEGIQAFTL